MPAGDSSSERVSPEQFERWFDNRKVDLVVMEVCGCDYWARTLRTLGIELRLLPAQPAVAMRNPAHNGHNRWTGTGKSL
jgi:hypothetical protein